MITYRLEFNPSQDCPWHIEQEPCSHEPNTNGWQTILIGVPCLEMIQAFTEHIDWEAENIFDGSYDYGNADELVTKFWAFKAGWHAREQNLLQVNRIESDIFEN